LLFILMALCGLTMAQSKEQKMLNPANPLKDLRSPRDLHPLTKIAPAIGAVDVRPGLVAASWAESFLPSLVGDRFLGRVFFAASRTWCLRDIDVVAGAFVRRLAGERSFGEAERSRDAADLTSLSLTLPAAVTTETFGDALRVTLPGSHRSFLGGEFRLGHI
jgi:hypothetical protein